MAKHKEPFKKVVMKYFWRVQQAQMIISMVFWSLTITGIFYPYVREKFNNFGIGQENVFLGMMVMFAIVIAAIILFGIIYDRLKFWKEQQLVIVERNPYASWKLNPLHSMWVELWLEMAKSIEKKSPELEEKIKLYEAWISRCREIDPWAAEMKTLIRRFALEGDDTVMRVFARNQSE